MKNISKKIKSMDRKRKVTIVVIGFISILLIAIVLGNSNVRKAFSNITVSSPYKSNEIEYDNKDKGIEATNMQGAIDELYDKCLKLKNECPEGYTCINNKYSASNDKKVNQISETTIEKSTLVSGIKITSDGQDVTSSCEINLKGGEGFNIGDTITFNDNGVYEIGYEVKCDGNVVITPSSYVIVNKQ